MESIAWGKNNLAQWLQTECGISLVNVDPIQGDASFRQYFRVYQESKSFIVMDASAQPESCVPFIAIANALRKMGLVTPEIISGKLEEGFLLLTDFGDATYLQTLNEQNADALYRKALSALALLQNCRKVEKYIIPPFTREFMWQEWRWHKEWFLEKLLSIEAPQILDHDMNILIESAVNQPQVFMHLENQANPAHR